MKPAVPKHEQRRFDPIFARLSAGSAACFGFEAAELVPVGYEERPFLYLCRVAVSRPGARTPELHVFVKIFKPKDPSAGVDMRARVSQDYVTTCQIHAFMSSLPGLGAVRPVACYEDLLTIVTEQADGLTLLDDLGAHAAWFPGHEQMERLVAAMRTVGRWLARYHEFQAADGEGTVAGLIDYVDIRLTRLADRGVMTAAERVQILKHLERLGEAVPREELREVAVHADLAPANILVSGDRIVVLDFAMASRATALHDISRLHMLVDLLRAKPQFRRRVLRRLQAALLEGLDPGLTDRRPLFRLLSMLHHVNHLGTLALRPEPFPGRLLSARTVHMHRRWIADELGAGTP